MNSGDDAAKSAAAAALHMRPMSIGELVDRAVTLFLRNFVPLLSLLAVVIVPLAIIQYFQFHDFLVQYFELLRHSISNPSTPPDVSKLQTSVLAAENWSGLYYLFLFIGMPFANAAVVIGISRAYLGGQVRFTDCYAKALQRWLYVLVLIVLWTVALAMAFAVLIPVTIVGAVLIGGLTALLKTFGAVLAAIVIILAVLAMIVVALMGYMAFAGSFVAVMLERIDPLRAFLLGFSRMFGHGLFWRSVLVALALLLFSLGASLVAGGTGALLFWITKSPSFFIIMSQVANLLFTAFGFVVVALYYYDIRIRQEGFDLNLLADQLAR